MKVAAKVLSDGKSRSINEKLEISKEVSSLDHNKTKITADESLVIASEERKSNNLVQDKSTVLITAHSTAEPCIRRGSRVRRTKKFWDCDSHVFMRKQHRCRHKQIQNRPSRSRNGRHKNLKEKVAINAPIRDVDFNTKNGALVKMDLDIKDNDKSDKFQIKTLEEKKEKNHAKLAERWRLYVERETDQQRQQRLQKARDRRRQRRGKDSTIVPPIISVPANIMDPEEITRLQREYIEFKEYVRNVMPKTSSGIAPCRNKLGHRKNSLKIESVKNELKDPVPNVEAAQPTITVFESIMDNKEIIRLQRMKKRRYCQLVITQENNENTQANGHKLSLGMTPASQEPSQVLYSNEPIDPEIALLETGEETFVPVQVIHQTCDDFDDMLEFENM